MQIWLSINSRAIGNSNDTEDCPSWDICKKTYKYRKIIFSDTYSSFLVYSAVLPFSLTQEVTWVQYSHCLWERLYKRDDRYIVYEFENGCREYFEINYLWDFGQKFLHTIKHRLARIQYDVVIIFPVCEKISSEWMNTGGKRVAIGTSWKLEGLWVEVTSSMRATFLPLKSCAHLCLDDFVLTSMFAFSSVFIADSSLSICSSNVVCIKKSSLTHFSLLSFCKLRGINSAGLGCPNPAYSKGLEDGPLMNNLLAYNLWALEIILIDKSIFI